VEVGYLLMEGKSGHAHDSHLKRERSVQREKKGSLERNYKRDQEKEKGINDI